ncbi:uncharacterized protein LOC108913651 [Anoplophora glabripennis]|uniref:uncharacterized protein LOC108913651 n=1 Tax=Anoplophora glabripennis TaxID=217634 RepID=UPI0008752D90|nr:uncharacterized protein LOC108913651 [Anoplophora glabripennis]
MECTAKSLAEEFVDNLLNEGKKIPCDETLESFKRTEVPVYYDEKLYKRGQAFFNENIYGLMFSKFLGLICVIALPAGLNVLIMTKMSGSDMTAYRRYLATVFHVKTWYDYDFRPGSRLLASIEDVKRKHNAASKQSIRRLKYRFSQMDMALTQFGFMGFGLVRGAMVGIHNPKEEDLKGFIHVWRVLGYILGIEDRFNICRSSVQETREISDILLKKVFTPMFEKPETSLVKMVNYLINGMSAVDPAIDYYLCMTYLQMVLENRGNYRKLENQNYKNISWWVKTKLSILSMIMYCLKFKIIRLYFQYITVFKLWLASAFPVLAYIRFGIKNGHVNFLKIIYRSKKSN